MTRKRKTEKGKKRRICLRKMGGILFLGLFLVFFCACDGLENGGKTLLSSSEALINLGGESFSKEEALIFLLAQKEIYESAYGEEVWSVALENGTLEDYIRTELREYLTTLFATAQMAKNQEVTLSTLEEGKIDLAAESFLLALGEGAEALSLTAEIVRDAFSHYALAQAMYEQIMSRADIEVSEDEARVVVAYRLLFSQEGLSFEEQEEQKEKANQAYALLETGESFASVSGQYGEASHEKFSLTRDELTQEEEEIVFLLKSGEFSPVMETEDGYVIWFCISSYDEEATKENRAALLEEKKKETFEQELEEFLQENRITFRTEVWNKIRLNACGDYAVNFYEFYQEYFSS